MENFSENVYSPQNTIRWITETPMCLKYYSIKKKIKYWVNYINEFDILR